MNINWPKLIGCVVAVVVGLFWAVVLVAMLTGCTTTSEVATRADDEASSLKCLGYCDLTITDRNIEIQGHVDLQKAENENE